MKKDLSAYLDLLRVSAALLVFVSHLAAKKISGGFLWQLEHYGHSAVIVFFVLSGFVIAYSADQKEKNLYDYSVARIARLYSVVLPALLLTVVCDLIGTHHNPGVYYMERDTMPGVRLAFGSLFLTQSWQKLDLLSNDPFWSLPYEFWYYVIFACVFFLKGRLRVVAVGLGCLIAGPAILLLFPIWLIGAGTYRLSGKLQTTAAPLMWAISSVLVLVTIHYNQAPTVPVSALLPNAWSILDYVIGLLLAINILAASQLNLGLARFRRPIAYIAGMTFALYLFHLPLLRLAAAYMPASLPVPARGIIAAIFALAVIFALSFITEGQKKRWRAAIRWLLHPKQKVLSERIGVNP